VAAGGRVPAAGALDSEHALHIATRLATPEQVLTAIAAEHATPSLVITNDAMAAQVARIWDDILEFPPTSVHDNFHELGGHSLALVRFAARVRDEFGVELPIDALFTDAFTVASITQVIRAHQSAPRDPEIEELLAELEQLSDAEVCALLENER
jgi:acyl carrier protein